MTQLQAQYYSTIVLLCFQSIFIAFLHSYKKRLWGGTLWCFLSLFATYCKLPANMKDTEHASPSVTCVILQDQCLQLSHHSGIKYIHWQVSDRYCSLCTTQYLLWVDICDAVACQLAEASQYQHIWMQLQACLTPNIDTSSQDRQTGINTLDLPGVARGDEHS